MIATDPDFPGIVKFGKNGDAYEIDLDVAGRYIQSLDQAKRDAARNRREELDLFAQGLGLSMPTAEPGLTVADRKALLEEEIVAIKLSKLRGEMIEKAGVEAAIGELLVWFQQAGATFSARLAKRADVPRELQIEIDTLMAADQSALAQRMKELAEKTAGSDGDDGSDILASTALDAPTG
ncbi:hypothetical protein [Sphingobium sp. LF-16]|uniref:hypothetical protein n=1 Tax=Sphingobium sp. LF-16 TaxID=2185111 RepID=UPI000F085CD7|nr:hypothetical protein [Sphingobium sp. LF-16]